MLNMQITIKWNLSLKNISHGFYVVYLISSSPKYNKNQLPKLLNYIKNDNLAFLFCRSLQHCHTDGMDVVAGRLWISENLLQQIYCNQVVIFCKIALVFLEPITVLDLEINTSLFLKHCSSGETSSTTFPKLLSIQETKYFFKSSNSQWLLMYLII